MANLTSAVGLYGPTHIHIIHLAHVGVVESVRGLDKRTWLPRWVCRARAGLILWPWLRFGLAFTLGVPAAWQALAVDGQALDACRDALGTGHHLVTLDLALPAQLAAELRRRARATALGGRRAG